MWASRGYREIGPAETDAVGSGQAMRCSLVLETMSVETRATVLSLSAALATVSIGLLATRGGLLAALGAAAGIAMLVKASMRPGDADLKWIAGGTVAWCALWGVALGSVYLGWESGEVVVLRPVDPATGETAELRVWVVDDEVAGVPVVFYDGSRDRLAAMGEQATLEWVRGDITHQSRPTLHMIDDASPEFIERITRLFESKYGELNWATDGFFLLTGRAPGRTVGILELGATDSK